MDKLELYDKLEKVLEKDLAPALGCTEPMCFGLCAATARRYAPGEILSITVEATTVMLKGVTYVRIPNSGGQRGGKLSAAIGAVLDRMEDGMKTSPREMGEIFEYLTGRSLDQILREMEDRVE